MQTFSIRVPGQVHVVKCPSNDAKYWMERAAQLLPTNHFTYVSIKIYNSPMPEPFSQVGLGTCRNLKKKLGKE